VLVKSVQYAFGYVLEKYIVAALSL